MKLTYLTWGYPHDDKIIRALEKLEIEVEKRELPFEVYREEEEKRVDENLLREVLTTAQGDIVFSVNFFSVVSELCQEEGLPYCSWVLSLPNYDLYTQAVMNSCNYMGICDSYLVEKLVGLGVKRVFLLPDAVEPGEKPEPGEIERGICFVGNQPLQRLYTGKMSLYNQGYIESFLHAQRVLYGAYILENGLLGAIQEDILQSHPIPKAIVPEFRKLYVADHYLAPSVICRQQKIFLQNANNLITIYSQDDFSEVEAVCRPYPEGEEERKGIYASKEFTLVLAPHTLHCGIPRQLLEVIVAGGFPLAGFQRDYGYFFQANETLAFFRERREFQRSVVRYGNDGKERERVRQAAYETVIRDHTYDRRIESMLAMWSRL